jgi:glycerol-3-phosphate O-acyltransferase / dihydroxyacetone phosphate acyltransferase
MTYAIVRGLARALLALFYRRIEIHGLEHVPARGALVIAANHHNALVDAMLLIATIPRRLAPLAKAPLFAHPLVAPFLWLVGAIPVHRRQDAGAGDAQNVTMFAAATAALRRGGAILIFPEGVSQPEPVLLPLRTGLARLTLDAVAGAQLQVTVLPVGLVFHRPADFRIGTAVVEIGAPVAVEDLVPSRETSASALDGPRPSSEVAVRALTDRVTAALRALIVEARDLQTLRLLEVAYDVWRADDAAQPGNERLSWMREVLRRSNSLSPGLRHRVDRLRRELERYDKDAAGQTAPVPGRTLRDGVALALGLPLAFLGMIIHGLGYRATTMTVRALRPDPDASATYQLMGGLVLFPLSWIVEAMVLGRVVGSWAVGPFVVALIPTGFYALSWRERLQRFPREFGATLSGRQDARLAVRRRWLRHELTALDRLTRT